MASPNAETESGKEENSQPSSSPKRAEPAWKIKAREDARRTDERVMEAAREAERLGIPLHKYLGTH